MTEQILSCRWNDLWPKEQVRGFTYCPKKMELVLEINPDPRIFQTIVRRLIGVASFIQSIRPTMALSDTQPEAGLIVIRLDSEAPILKILEYAIVGKGVLVFVQEWHQRHPIEPSFKRNGAGAISHSDADNNDITYTFERHPYLRAIRYRKDINRMEITYREGDDTPMRTEIIQQGKNLEPGLLAQPGCNTVRCHDKGIMITYQKGADITLLLSGLLDQERKGKLYNGFFTHKEYLTVSKALTEKPIQSPGGKPGGDNKHSPTIGSLEEENQSEEIMPKVRIVAAGKGTSASSKDQKRQR